MSAFLDNEAQGESGTEAAEGAPRLHVQIRPIADSDEEIAILEVVRMLLAEQKESVVVRVHQPDWSRAAKKDVMRAPYWSFQAGSWNRQSRNGAR